MHALVREMPPPVFHARVRWGLILGVLALYTLTTCPTVHWGDSGELIFAGIVLGIAHPPGHPLYSMLAHLFSWLPFGAAAWRINWFSAVFGVVTVGLTFELAADTLRRLGTPPQRATACAAAAAALFAVTTGLWGGSTVAETTTLHAAFLATLFWLAWRIGWTRPSGATLTQALGAAAALYGFSATNHVAGILFLPALAVLLVGRCGREVLHPRNVAVMFASVLAGLSLYAFLYLRSQQNPPLDWANPETLQNFWWVVTAQQFQGGMTRTSAGAGAWAALGERSTVILQEWTLVGTALVVVGLLRLARRAAWLAMFIVLCLAPLIALGLKEAFILAYFVPGLLLLTVALAVGMDAVVRRRGTLPAWAAGALAAGMVAWSGFAHYDEAALQNDRSAEVYGKQVLAHFEPNAAFFTTAGDQAFIFWALQSGEGLRQDVAIINPTWGATNYAARESLEQLYPDMKFLTAAEVRPYEERWNRSAEVRGVRVAALLLENAGRRPLYIGVPPNDTLLQDQLELVGDVLRFHKTPGDYVTPEAIATTHAYWEEWFARLAADPALQEEHLLKALSTDLNNQGMYLESAGHENLALWCFDRAITMHPDTITARINRGRLRGRQENWTVALEDFREAVALAPRNPRAHYFLGTALEATGNLDTAYEAYLETLLWAPADGDALRRAGVLMLRTGDRDRARQYFHDALAANRQDSKVALWLLWLLLTREQAADELPPTRLADPDNVVAAGREFTRGALRAERFPDAAEGLRYLQALGDADVHVLLLMAEYAARTGQPGADDILAQAFEQNAATARTLVANADWAAALVPTDPTP